MSAQAFFQKAKTVLLDDAAHLAYYDSRLPGPKDDEITRLVEDYLAEDPQERLKIASGLSETQASWLGTYAHRMSMVSVRKKSPDILRTAIVALMISAKVTDPRETTMTMSVLYRAAQLLLVGDGAFRGAASDAPGADVEQLFLGFLNRADPSKTIQSMGYREETGKNGVIFVYGTQPIPAGFL